MSQTLLLTGGRIYLNRGQFAEAMIIADGIIQAVGTDAAMRAAAPADAEVYDLAGRTVIPGFNDSHIHLAMKGELLEEIELHGCRSIAEVAARVREFIAEHNPPAGTVLQGRGWNQDYFAADGHRLITRADLDAITTEHPLILVRACTHILTCNSAALAAAGLTRDSVPVDGGSFDRDENGELNGVVRENACDQIFAIRGTPSLEDGRRQVRAAMQYAVSNGVTSVQTMDMRPHNWEYVWNVYNSLAEEDPILRVYHQVNFMEPAGFRRFLSSGFRTGYGTAWNRVGPLKMFLDGSLGARTALLREPYHDEPGQLGIATLTPTQTREMVALAVEHNCQVALHAIGDGAVELALNTYLPYTADGNNPLRLGVIHVQITDRELLARFPQQNVAAYLQPIFLHYDIHMVEDRVGSELASTSYAYGTLHRTGTHISFGSDCPVEEINPFANIYCAVTRRTLDAYPEEGFNPQEALDIYDAVDAYTTGSAYFSFDEHVKGRLLPGFYADLVVLSDDIFTIPSEEILNLRVDATMTGGRFVYQRTE